jgi:hypothetical protein
MVISTGSQWAATLIIPSAHTAVIRLLVQTSIALISL